MQILFILTNALCAAIFAFAYPETRGVWQSQHRLFHDLADISTGKSLEQIDEIFGDIQKRQDLEMRDDGKSSTEKAGLETVEMAR
jgi:hypothetical protein